MTPTKANRPAASKFTSRRWQVGIAASLMLTASPLALHAETSNAELAREISELKAQIHAMKGAISETRVEARRARRVVVAAPAYIPPYIAALPPGATPVFATADKKMIFGALTITPGGFVNVNGIYRSRNLQSDVTSSYNAIPTNNNNLAHLNESRISMRQSRAALLVEAPIAKNYLVAAYGEFDLNAAGTTSNLGQTNSFIPRVRNLYATLDADDYGLHVLAGQNWSLITANSKGITPRNEVLPAGEDSGVLPGYSYGRIPQIRIVKDFDKKLWIALDAELAQTQGINGACGALVSNTSAAPATASPNSIPANTLTGVASGSCQAIGAGSFAGGGESQSYSLNTVPDVLGKVAYEAKFAGRDVHLEAVGIYKNSTSYVNYSGGTPYSFSTQHNSTGGGVGGAIVATIIPGKLDILAKADYGRGLGRYTSTGLPDATVTSDGIIHDLRGISAMVGGIAHVTPSFDVYAYAGFDQIDRMYSSNGAQTGYGAIGGVNNTGCNVLGWHLHGSDEARAGDLTIGFSDKIYKGSFGLVTAGVQYEYVQRLLFGGTANANGIATAANPFTSARGERQHRVHLAQVLPLPVRIGFDTPSLSARSRKPRA